MNSIKPIVFFLLGASITGNVIMAVECRKQKKVSDALFKLVMLASGKEPSDE